MTTIAYKGGVIAYDSRESRGQTILTDNCEKKEVRGDKVFFGIGSISGIERLINACCGDPIIEPMDANLVLVEKGIVYHVGYDPKSEPKDLWRSRVNNGEAWGSGEDHAMTAMDMGASAKEAILMAMKRDSGTGGEVRKFIIKEQTDAE